MTVVICSLAAAVQSALILVPLFEPKTEPFFSALGDGIRQDQTAPICRSLKLSILRRQWEILITVVMIG